jgi:hypothetical protein
LTPCAAHLALYASLFRGLDPSRGQDQAKVTCQSGDGPDYRTVVHVRAQLGDEGAVDVDNVKGQLTDPTE